MDIRSTQNPPAAAGICDDPDVLARRMLLFFAIVLLAAAFSSALTTSTRDDEDDAAAPTVPVSQPQDRVTASVPAKKTVKAKVGDVIELDVKAEQTDRAEIRPLGVDVAVGPGLPATLLVIADRAGEFPITLRYTGREIGTLTVSER